MSVDLEPIEQDVRALLSQAVALYLAKRSESPEQFPLVTRVELAFSVSPTPTMHVDFDVRADPQPDGEAAHPRIVIEERPAWSRIFNPRGEIVSLRFADGSWKEIDRSSLHAVFAEFLVATLRNARSSGVFRPITAAGSPMVTLEYDDGTT